MEPNTLRVNILKCLAEHELTGANAGCEDEALAAATGATKADVQRQLDILEDQGLVTLARTFGPTYGALLTPKGTLAVEQLRDPPSPAPPKIGF